MADPVGPIEIAPRLGVDKRTVDKWLEKGLMPDPDYPSVNGLRAWEWRTVLRWAGVDGRIRNQDAEDEFRRLFGRAPVVPRRGRTAVKLTRDEIHEIETGTEPPAVVAARHDVSEAYVFKLRREYRRRTGETPPAGKPAAKKPAAARKKPRKKAPASKTP